jgi:fucose 4-O-acetylase-like acetyltransferase
LLSSASKPQRMEWVDYAKGLAIILVVYRHALVGINRAGIDVPDFLFNIQEFVLNFRMPVFFMLSGLFLDRAIRKNNTRTLIKQKSSTLLYPYLLWTTVFITLQILLSSYTNSVRTIRDYTYIVTQPRNLDHMWYLFALFNTNVLYILVSPFLSNRRVLHIFLAVFLHLVAYTVRDYSIISDLFYHYIFLMLGAMLSEKLFAEKKETKVNHWLLLAITPLFILGQLTWLRLRPGSFEMQFLFLVIILVACMFFYFVCRSLYAWGICKAFSFIGKYSLYIYILHLFVISSFRILSVHFLHITNVYFIVLTGLVLGIGLPILVYRVGKPFGIDLLFSLERKKALV